ncbi:major facilitator superfamily-domain-containing protein [Halenospora varia]|nr:major facilitator superfamily-domain-containing protein [Halenospora varia]
MTLSESKNFVSNLRDKKHPNIILTVVCSAVFLDLVNLSAITIALPTLQKEFGVKSGDLQWVISAYALTFGAFLMLGGRGGDMFGHRPILLFGMTFFALFTLVSALTPSFIGLIIARAFQGIGAAFTIPSAQAHIAIHFTEPSKKARAIGIWAASGSVGFIIGLILGGVLTSLLSWRWIFWISLIFSGVNIPLAFFLLPSEPRDRATASPSDETGATAPKPFFTSFKERLFRFDIPGISLGLPGILVLTYALTSSNQTGWGSPTIISTLVVSVLLLVAFGLYESRASTAILPTHLFKSTSFNLTLVLAVITYAIRQACTYFLTVQLQSYGNSPIHTSVLFIPLGISALVFNTLSGRLIPVLGARVMLLTGWVLTLTGVLLFSFITPSTSYWAFAFPGMLLYIAGIGAVYITSNFLIISSASKSDQGAAAGVFNVALQVGGSVVGLAVLTALAQGECLLGVCCVGGVGLAVSYWVGVPEGMRGSLWLKGDGESDGRSGRMGEEHRENSVGDSVELRGMRSET